MRVRWLIAAKAWIKAAKKTERAIPEPSIASNCSGKFVMRVPKELHAELSRSAKVQGVSLNQYILYLLVARHAGGQVVVDRAH